MLIKNKKINLSKLKKKKINYRKYLINNTNFNISKITRLSYDLQSGSYIESHKKIMKNKTIHPYFFENMKKISKYINNKNVKTILDFGTGEGIKLPHILKYSNQLEKIFACDISFNRLSVGYDYLKKELKKKELSKIFLFCNKDYELPFKKNSIDVVLTSGVFENMSNNKMTETILELLRISKKGLILVEPKDNSITKTEFKRMKKFKINYNLNKILKKNKINYKEDTWNKISKSHDNETPYSIRIIDKKSKFVNNPGYYLKEENYALKRINNFFYTKYGKIIPILNNITIFRSLKDLNYIK